MSTETNILIEAVRENGQPSSPTDMAGHRLISENGWLRRFDRSSVCVRVIRVYEDPSGRPYSRVTDEPWKGL